MTVEVQVGDNKPAAAPTFAERLKADAGRVEYETDDAGRKIGVKKLNAIDMFDLTILLGESAINVAALNQALLVASIVEIDGDKLPRLSDMIQLRSMISRLDFHGYAAAGRALARFGPRDDKGADDAAKN